MKKISLLAIILLIAGGTFVVSAQNLPDLPVIRHGAVLETLALGFSFTEGPTPDSKGNVYFTDQPNDRIMEWTIAEKLITFMQPSGRSNGMFTDSQGNIWSCADEKTELWKIGTDGSKQVVVSGFEGKPFNGPNDVWVRPDGGAYVTDPFYARPWWNYKLMPQTAERVYYIAPGSSKAVAVIDDLEKPNGIVGTPDGHFLYVADIKANRTFRYLIGKDGSLSGKQLFCELGSDGMTMDELENIYITGDGVTIFDKTGKKIGNIPVPGPWTANVCFGGADHKSLFITATTGLYRVKMNVKGAF